MKKQILIYVALFLLGALITTTIFGGLYLSKVREYELFCVEANWKIEGDEEIIDLLDDENERLKEQYDELQERYEKLLDEKN